MNRHSAFLIGEGSLSIACAKLMVASIIDLKAIISKNNKVIKWCAEHGIRHIDSGDDYREIISADEFDYLFSIINDTKIPLAILNLPKKMAINYHDSLLPAYAGVHATSWAILLGESKHGVSWHVMNDKIDDGVILLQQEIDISPHDTTFSLNLKCFETAVKTFNELLNKLAQPIADFACLTKTTRSFYTKAAKPVNNGVINWGLSTTDLKQQLLAANFGFYENDFFTSKIKLGNKIYSILKASILVENAAGEPGQIIHCDDTSIQVKLADAQLRIEHVTDYLYPVVLGSIVMSGQQLAVETPEDLATYKALCQACHAYEEKLIQQLTATPLVTLPFKKKLTKAETTICADMQLANVSKVNLLKTLLTVSQNDNASLLVNFKKQRWNISDSLNNLFFELAVVNKKMQDYDKSLPISANVQTDIFVRYPQIRKIFPLPLLVTFDFQPELIQIASVIINCKPDKIELIASPQVLLTNDVIIQFQQVLRELVA